MNLRRQTIISAKSFWQRQVKQTNINSLFEAIGITYNAFRIIHSITTKIYLRILEKCIIVNTTLEQLVSKLENTKLNKLVLDRVSIACGESTPASIKLA